MKIGRNQPCPCGSGKKYKKCCLGKGTVSHDLLWRRLREVHDRLIDRLMNHALEELGEEGMSEALLEFMVWPEKDVSPESLENHFQLFYQWLLFNWYYDPEEMEIEIEQTPYTTIAESYAALNKHLLDPLEHRLIDATNREPFSFWEILDCQPGKGYCMKDVLRGDTVDVLEKMGSEDARKGDIVFCKVIHIDTVAILMGTGSVLIPPMLKPELIELRKELGRIYDPITTETLNDYEIELRELYFSIFDVMMNPPELRNTDGDPLSFHTIYYDIDSPETAFERLKSLCVDSTEKELRSEAELDESGQIHRASIPWSRQGYKNSSVLDNTILGRLEIDGKRLKVEVNSANRANAIQKEIQKRLGKHAVYKTTKIHSMESMLKKTEHPETHMGEDFGEKKNLLQIPEVQNKMAQLIQAHWDSWINEKIPALGGKTPRQAVKTADGRESVEALLLDAERHSYPDNQIADIEQAAIDQVRHRLGLDKAAVNKDVKDDAKRLESIQKMIQDFGQAKLNPMYTEFALKLSRRISRMRSLSIKRGRIEIWAAAIVYVIARLNFLFDPENSISITTDELCAFFGTKKNTVSNKAGLIQRTADIYYGNEEFSSPDIIKMFRILETEEGFLIPASTLDERNDKSSEQKKHATESQKTTKPKEKTAKKADDRQLRLFSDE
ncbi:MAG: SEC-C domain-containing protein [Deltaproteobacteria bacterium]|nr:SEC-C domain-containing protein [Deltaproteobacteria bacterium]MBW2154170.1 SEC-C domain-containing protein [Deltaproteobacteria bacterium]